MLYSTVGASCAAFKPGARGAELMPDRAASLTQQARSYGESRVICGAHYKSDVEAGCVVASALFSVPQANCQFHADLGSARAELAAKRAQSPHLMPWSAV